MTLKQFYKQFVREWKQFEKKRDNLSKTEISDFIWEHTHTKFIAKLREELEKVAGKDMPGKSIRVEYHGPCGLRCQYFVEVIDRVTEEVIYCICISVGSNVWDFLYDTGEKKNMYDPGTIGAINGMNNVSVPLPIDAKKILEIMKTLNRKEE